MGSNDRNERAKDYQYTNVCTKSPSAQFIPRTLQIPPAKPQPNAANPDKGYNGLAYPIVGFKAFPTNETWSTWINDAR
jgi:hypothetical protein